MSNCYIATVLLYLSVFVKCAQFNTEGLALCCGYTGVVILQLASGRELSSNPSMDVGLESMLGVLMFKVESRSAVNGARYGSVNPLSNSP